MYLCYRYAFKFLEEVNPVIDTQELEAMHEEVEQEQKSWEQDLLQRIKEQEQQRMDDDHDDSLFYEVVT